MVDTEKISSNGLTLPYRKADINRLWSLPSSRATLDSNVFQKVDKFDTWLDLNTLVGCIQGLDPDTTFLTSEVGKWTRVISPETCISLRMCNMRAIDLQSLTITPTLPATIINTILRTGTDRCHIDNQPLRALDKMIRQSASISTRLQMEHLLSNCSDSFVAHLNSLFTKTHDKIMGDLPSVLIRVRCASEDMLKIHLMHKELFRSVPSKSITQRAWQKLQLNEKTFFLPSINATVRLFRDLIIFRMGGKGYLLNHDLFLECINKVQELESTLIYAWCQSGTSLPSNHLEFIEEFIKHLCSVVTKFSEPVIDTKSLHYANTGFAYLKTIEGLGAAYMIYMMDGKKGWVNDQLLNTLWGSVYASRLQSYPEFESSYLGRLWDSVALSQVAECLGLVKLCGHPGIEVEAGLAKLRERTHEQINVSNIAVRRSICVLKRDIILNFYKVHNTYPLIDLRAFPRGSLLGDLLRKRISPFNPESKATIKRVPLDEWDKVVILKNAEFDPVENQFLLLKDKALGLTQSKVFQLLKSDCPYESIGAKVERRALLKYLLTPYFEQSFTTYLENYINEDDWSSTVLDYLVIKLTMKELEEKCEGRPFGASPQEERNRRVVQDQNVMKLMDQYVPEQLMTPDELSMIRKLYSFRSFRNVYKDHTILQVSFDFSKWNNSMRDASIRPPARDVLDQWFGINLFSKTMQAFEKSLVYYVDKSYCDWWLGQEGGIEGLAQGTWSYIFLGGCKQALESLGMIFQITVKGDDVRVALAIPPATIKELGYNGARDMIMNQLQALCKDMGWSLNPQESFVSLSLIATSKQYQIDDTWMPASDKKMMKLQAMTNVIIPTLDDIVSSVFSTSHSAMSQATVCFPGFIAANWCAAKIIAQTLYQEKLAWEDVATLLLWPQVIGGPGSLPLETYLIRGENDMLSLTISLLRYILNSTCHESLKLRIRRVLQIPVTTKRDLKMLLGDPYSIPLDVPPRPHSVLKRLITRHLPNFVKNPTIKKLLTHSTLEDEKKFCDLLTSMRPYSAKLASLLFECSPFYIRKEIVAKFLSSSTVFTFLCYNNTATGVKINKSKAHHYFRRILQSAAIRQRFWIMTLRGNNRVDKSDELLGIDEIVWEDDKVCAASIAYQVRCKLWDLNIEHITYPSLISQNMMLLPTDLDVLARMWPAMDVNNTIMVFKNNLKFQLPDRSAHYAVGTPEVPWLGSRTSSNSEMPKLRTRIRSPTLDKVLKLMSVLRSGTSLGEDFTKLVYLVLKGLTSLNLTNLEILAGEAAGGGINHRVAIASYSLNTMPNCRPNLFQITKVEAESNRTLRGDASNRTINFAGRHFYMSLMSTLVLQMNENFPVDYPDVVHSLFHYDPQYQEVYTPCPHCLKSVDDVVVRVNWEHTVDLSDYADLSAVGCSDYEERILRQNMKEAIIGKVRAFAKFSFIDPDSDISIELATAVVLHSAFGQTLRDHQLAMSFEADTVVDGPSLLVVSAMWSPKVMSQLSQRVLRLMKPETLYQCVVSECYMWVLDTLDVTADIESNADLHNMSKYNNPLKIIFDNFRDADVLYNLIRGGKDCKWIEKDLTFPPSCHREGHLAAQAFVQAHLHLFRDWTSKGDFPTKLVFFGNSETAELIGTDLDRQRLACWSAAVRYLNFYVLDNSLLSDLHRLCAFMEQNVKEFGELCRRINNDDRVPDITFGDFWNRDDWQDTWAPVRDAVIQYREEFAECVEALDTWLANIGNVPSYDYTHWLDSLVRFWILTSLDNFFIDAPLVDFTDPEVRTSLNDLLLVLAPDNIETTTTTPRIDFIYDTRPLRQWYMRIRIRTYVCLNVLGSSDTWWRWEDTLMDRCLRLHANAIDKIRLKTSRVMVGVMRLADAEKLIKEQVVHSANTGSLAPLITQERERQAYEFRVNQLRSFNCPLDKCLRDRIPFSSMMLANYAASMAKAIENSSLLVGISESRIVTIKKVDYKENYRIFGSQNHAIIKLLTVIMEFRLFDTLLSKRAMVGTSILCLADGSGTISRFFYDTYTASDIIYCSLQVSMTSGQRTTDGALFSAPSAFFDVPDISMEHSRLHYRNITPGDLSLDATFHQIVATWRQRSSPVSFITSDMDRSPSQDSLSYWRSQRNIIRIASYIGTEQTVLVVRLRLDNSKYCSLTIPWFYYQFMHTHLIHCDASRSHDREMYIVAIGVRSTGKVDDKFLDFSDTVYPSFNVDKFNDLSIIADVTKRTYLFSYTPEPEVSTGMSHTVVQLLERGIIPASFDYLFNSMMPLKPGKVHHVCKVILGLGKLSGQFAQKSRIKLVECLKDIIDLDVRKFTIRSEKNAVLARGLGAMIKLLLNTASYGLVSNMMMLYREEGYKLTNTVIREALLITDRELAEIMKNVPPCVTMYYKIGQVFLSVGNSVLSMTTLYYQSIIFVQRVLAYVTLVMYHYQNKVDATNHEAMQEEFRTNFGLIWEEPCCSAFAERCTFSKLFESTEYHGCPIAFKEAGVLLSTPDHQIMKQCINEGSGSVCSDDFVMDDEKDELATQINMDSDITTQISLLETYVSRRLVLDDEDLRWYDADFEYIEDNAEDDW